MRLSEFQRYGLTDNVTQIVLEAFEYLAKPNAPTRVLELDEGVQPIVDAGINGAFRFGADGMRIKGAGPTSGFRINPKSYVTAGGNYGLFNTWGHSDIQIDSFAIDGQRASATLPGKIGNNFVYVADGSSRVRTKRLRLTNLANVTGAEAFAVIVSGGATDFAADDCDVAGIAGTAFNLSGQGMQVTRSRVQHCDWNSVSVYGGKDVVLDRNTLSSPAQRNVNLEHWASTVIVTGNICQAAGYANIGNYDEADAVLIVGNTLSGAGTGTTFPIAEIDLTGSGRMKIGPNIYAPKGGAYLLRTTGPMPNLVIEDAELTPIRILKQ